MFNVNLDFIKNKLDEKKECNILLIGDSLISQEWVHPNSREMIEYAVKETLISYASEERSSWTTPSWGIRFFNCGYDGITSKELSERIDTHIIKYNPDMALLMVGDGDWDFNLSPTDTLENIKQIIKRIRTITDKLFFISSPKSLNAKWNKHIEEYLETQLKYFSQNPNDCHFVDLYKSMSNLDLSRFYTFKSQGNPDIGLARGEIDYVHPNSLGNGYIAHVLLKEIFGIRFNPEQYLEEVSAGIMLPKFDSSI